MKVCYEFDLNSFEAWSGAVGTIEVLREHGKIKDAEAYIEEIFQDGCSETDINDFLWFDNEYLFELLGIPTYDSISAELAEKEAELVEVEEDYREELKEWENDPDMTKEDIEDHSLYYYDEFARLKEEIEGLEEKLSEL